MRALLLSLLLAVPAFAGPPTKFPEQIKGHSPPDYLVRVFAYDEEDGTRNSGTGTLIRPDYIVTASHVVSAKEGSKVEILFFTDWSVVTGTVVKVSPNNDTDGRDVAIIKLDKPRSEKPLAMLRKTALGSVMIQGFSHGPYTEQLGTYFTIDKSHRWGMIRGAQARNGDSGGPVTQNGALAGVLWGSAEDQTWFTPVEFLYELYPELFKTDGSDEAEPEEEKDDAQRIRIKYTL